MRAGIFLVLTSLSVAASLFAGAAEPRLEFHADPEDEHFGTVSVFGLPAAALASLKAHGLKPELWSELFQVHTGDAEPDWPAVLGTYSLDGEVIRFRPRFSFAAGMTYRAGFDGALHDQLLRSGEGVTPSLKLIFTMPEPEQRQATRVERIYPTTRQVPENLLRLYVYFSAPINPKGVQDHVHLYDDAGNEVSLPFVEIENGLWDRDFERLTLFFHPGRIKRGVAPHMAMGPPLRAGETFRLVIDEDLLDAAGHPLVAEYKKDLIVVAPDRVSPDHETWRISPPTSERSSLVIEFPGPLDHALLQRFIFVENPSGERIAGKVEVANDETRWSLFPDSPWESGRYTILVNPLLEDLAGNTFSYLFDTEGGGSKNEETDPPHAIELSFQVRPD